MVKRFGLGKMERLKSRRQIKELFARGKRLSVFPITATYQFEAATGTPVLKTGVTASKKNFKKAVDRNQIKRLLREAYRLQKETILEAMKLQHTSGFIFFIYTDKTLPSFPIIREAMKTCLDRLQQKLPS